MLSLVVAWLFLGSVSWVIGTGILNRLEATCFSRKGDRLIIAIWLGVLILSILLLAISLVFPLTPIVGCGASFFLISATLLSKNTRIEIKSSWLSLKNLSLSWLIILITLVTLTAIFTAQSVSWYDTGLYHFQAVQWFSKFGTVPGLALIHNRFGTSSSWLALAAPFNFGILETRISTLLGGFAFGLASLQVIISLSRLFKDNGKLSDWFAFFCLIICLSVFLFWRIPLSLSPDLPLAILIVIFSWLIILLEENRLIFNNDQALSKSQTILLIVASGSITIKLSAISLVLVYCLYVVYNKSNNQSLVNKIGAFIVINILILSPLLVFNIFTSGCPLYPTPFFCLNLPWSIEAKDAQQYSEVIRDAARWNFGKPSSANNWNWIIPWIYSESQATFLLIVSLASAVYIIWSKKIKKKEYKWIVILGFLGNFLVLYSAPALRFGLGYFVIIPSLAMSYFAVTKNQGISWSILIISGAVNGWLNFSHTLVAVIAITMLFFVLFNSLKSIVIKQYFYLLLIIVLAFSLTLKVYFQKPEIRMNLILPPKLDNKNKAAFLHKQINDITYISPNTKYLYQDSGFWRGEAQCWAQPLPCTYSLTYENIRLRDPHQGLKGGFVKN